MRVFRSREDSLKFWLSFFLILGSVTGSIFCNRMDTGMKEELQTVERSMVTAAVLMKMDFWGLFLTVLKKRLGQLAFAFLLAMTQAAPVLFMCVSGYLGFSVSVTVCALTMESGLMGIIRFLALIFPQICFYGTVFYVLVWWMQVQGKRLTVMAGAALTAAAVLGAAAESFINPWIIAFVMGK